MAFRPTRTEQRKNRLLRATGSTTAKAAVDGDQLAGHELGGRRGQETGDAGNVFGCAPPLQQRLAAGSLLPVLGSVLPQAVLIQPGARQFARTSAPANKPDCE